LEGAAAGLEAGGEATARTARCLARRSGSARPQTATAGERKAVAATEGMAVGRGGSWRRRVGVERKQQRVQQWTGGTLTGPER
jgi:hypothetical protein